MTHNTPQIVLERYTGAEIPPHIWWQVVTFKRVEWPWDDDGLIGNQPFANDDLHAMYFALLNDKVLISHALVTREVGKTAARVYRILGLGDVFTFPAYRKKGYGMQVVRAATDHMIQASEADFGMLFCGPHMEGFYRKSGWQPLRMTVTYGDEASPQLEGGLTMVHFLGNNDHLRGELTDATIFIGRHPW